MRLPHLVMLAMLVPLAACASTRPATYLVEPAGPYTLDTGDAVRVTVYGDANLTNTYRVDDSGAISVPLVGSVRVRDMTTGTAAQRLAGALSSGYMRSPDVAVEIAEYRPFYIQGAVGNSGQFPYVYGMTVRSAVSTAGGFADTADRARATVYRRQGEQMVRGVVNLDFPLQPGDTVVINERWF